MKHKMTEEGKILELSGDGDRSGEDCGGRSQLNKTENAGRSHGNTIIL